MKLEQKYYKYRKGDGGVHISFSSFKRTLCSMEMNEMNTAYGKAVPVDCFECLKTYKQETGIDLNPATKSQGEQQTLF